MENVNETMPNITLKFELTNDDKTVTQVQEIHIDHILKAIRMSANDQKRLNDLRQLFVLLQWETDNLIDKCQVRNRAA